MRNSQAIQAIENVLAKSKLALLSTAYNNKPNSRYMVFYNDGLNLYTKTNIHSAKVKEIKDNPAAYVLFGYNDTTNRSFVEMEATLEVVNDQKVIAWLWETKDKSVFSSKEDPELSVLKGTPQSVNLM
ncbi:pyridoxamine 5'-phosphate oxidase family protein, partial [Staphylococcus aureus]|uniref:pyridoxamine 5'-phosphate oxidase family protein n=1 Tax=Staphylococcus aureus TaxID=1280 RepID=UPI00210A3430